METIDTLLAAQDQCDSLDIADDRLAREILDHVADKWSLWVIHDL